MVMSVTVRIGQCASCGGLLASAPDDEVSVASVVSVGVATEEQELICDQCCVRLAKQHEGRAPAGRKRVG
jgi:hypothetical protein